MPSPRITHRGRRRTATAFALGLVLLVGGFTQAFEPFAANAVSSEPTDVDPTVMPADDEVSVNDETANEGDASEPGTGDENPSTSADDSTLDTNNETATSADQVATKRSKTAPSDSSVTPFAVNPNFASQNLNRYFSLVTSSSQVSGLAPVHIRNVTMDSTSSAFGTQVANPWLTPAAGLSVPAGRNAPAGSITYRKPNALGVTDDGVFFFTNQYQQRASQNSNDLHEYIDVWRWESGSPTGQNAVLTRIVSGLDLGKTIAGNNPQQIVAGAYNAFDETYYFGFYRPVAPSAQNPGGRIAMHLYRAEDSGGNWTAGQVGTAITPLGKYLSGTNGDFTFDSGGNLTFLVSDSGNPAPAYIGTIPTVQLQGASAADPKVFTDFTISSLRQFTTGSNDGQANGVVFTRSGQLVIQPAIRQQMVNPTTFGNTAALTNLSIYPPNQGSAFMTTDLAGFASPPTVEVQKNVVSRIDPTDQFVLGIGASAASSQQITTDGVGGNLTGTGIQDRVLGPVGAFQGDTVLIGEEMAPGSATNTAQIGSYSPTYACINQNVPEGDMGHEISLTGSNVTGRSFVIPQVGPTEWRGPRVLCTITNNGAKPDLVVSKQSDPASGVAVDPGNTVKFSLAFDNTGGSAAATEVSYTDHLADVLDDASFVSNSLKVRDVTASNPADHTDVTNGFFAFYDQAAKKIKIAGAADGTGTAIVPASKKYAVVYEVKAKPNVDAEGNTRDNGTGTTAYRLTNYLVKGNETPPTACTPPAQDEQPLCSDHHVRSWTASKKESRPASGATLHAGGNIYYSLEVEKVDASYAIDGIVVTDDLTGVYDYATWDASAPDLSAQGALTRGIYFFNAAGNIVRTINQGDLPTGTTLDEWVPAPTETGGKWTLTTKPFELKAGEVKAQVWFAVKINNPLTGEVGAPFVNTYSALAGSSEPTPNQCETGEPSTHKAACETSHQVAEDFFAIRKDGTGTLANGTRGPLTNLIGHQLEIRVDDNGTMGTSEPANKCDVTGSNAQTCWSFAQIASGEQAGRWRADKLPAGTYWLLETQAPNEQRLDANTKRSVTGVQLLAEPIKFRVASAAESGADHPAPGVPDKNVIQGQVDVFKPGTTTLLDRCDADGTGARPTACSNPTGYLMVVSDPGTLPLPFTGAAAPWLLGIGGLGGLGLLIAGFYYWSSRRQAREL